jgi:hypothetical protein
MMAVPKIQLSPTEAELMNNATIILTKNRVLDKMKQLLQSVQEMQVEFIGTRGLHQKEPFIISPKISKGEYYMGLPYLILDYPRTSQGADLFFIRTMFWWGNFFSSTLHLSGKFKEVFMPVIIDSYGALDDLNIGINEDPWIHHFEPDNYLRIANINRNEFEQRCRQHAHLKLGASWPLHSWEQAPIILYEHWKFLLEQCGLVT